MNIPLSEYQAMPVGELGDMIACHQIVNGAKQKFAADDDEMIPDII